MSEVNKAVETGVEEVKVETTDVAVKQETGLVKAGGAYITELLYKIKEEFISVNEGIDLDFVYMGDRLVTDKKGNFVEADDDTVKYGDSIDVVIGAGEKLFSLWGKQDSPEDGTLIVAESTLEKAEEVFGAWIEENPEAADRYEASDIQLRFVVYFVPVASLAVEDDELPQIYLMTFPTTATIGFGKYSMKIFKGKYKANGIKTGTAVNRVVTRISTVDKKSKSNAAISYIGLEYEAIGMFNPEEYGIKEDQA